MLHGSEALFIGLFFGEDMKEEKQLFSYDELVSMCMISAAQGINLVFMQNDEIMGRKTKEELEQFLLSRVRTIIDLKWQKDEK